MLSVSTCWNSGRHTEGDEMIHELLDLGFDRVELGHGIRLSLMEGVQRMVEAGKVTISSLHNFCPLPVEITRASPDCYQFSSPDDRERERAVKFSLQTIDFAARLNAKFVVLHMGRSPLNDFTDQLIRMAEVGLGQSRKYVQTKLDCVKQREARSEPYMRRSLECLRRIANYAAEKDIRLGVESRHSYEELPNENEMIDLLNNFNLPHVGYWHDFGHVQVKHNLGFLDHVEWLTEVAPRLIGCHLHDTQWPGRDHMAPFQGEVEYRKLIPLLPKSTLFVFEMSPRRTKEEIIEGREKWQQRFGEWCQ